MKDIIINVSHETRMVKISKNFMGTEGENLQGNIIFKFSDEFVQGAARIEYIIDGESKYQMLTRQDESYVIPIRSLITKQGNIDMQLVITEEGTDENIPIFKSNMFYVYCNRSINAEAEEEPSELPTWIEIANAKLAEVDGAIIKAGRLDIEASKIDGISTVIVTRQDGTEQKVEIHDGEKGKDALINGENVINIVAGENITINQEDKKLTINAKESSYDDTELRNKINIIDEDLGTVQDDVQSIYNDIENLENDKADRTELPNLEDYLLKQEFNNENSNYVKQGLVNNTNTLTDEEKLKIETWLGLSETYLTMYNTTPYQVNSNYVPAHKKYVDNLVGNIDILLQDIDTGNGV